MIVDVDAEYWCYVALSCAGISLFDGLNLKVPRWLVEPCSKSQILNAALCAFGLGSSVCFALKLNHRGLPTLEFHCRGAEALKCSQIESPFQAKFCCSPNQLGVADAVDPNFCRDVMMRCMLAYDQAIGKQLACCKLMMLNQLILVAASLLKLCSGRMFWLLPKTQQSPSREMLLVKR
ncbi:hypothetical protein Nepgr_010369 [Nepenthes gracilis]|uniref:Uncharacterized protein n=1 Tax=Nepenthes gracilis TaxID=150966 RepID=A0AAD3SCR5_NEPGR|nr:hypothetical protein Nepgr_010369 [Nepenthes gracilis]